VLKTKAVPVSGTALAFVGEPGAEAEERQSIARSNGLAQVNGERISVFGAGEKRSCNP